MFSAAYDLSLLGDLLAVFAYVAFALNFALRLWRKAVPAHGLSYIFLGALTTSALWAWFGLMADGLHWPDRTEALLLPFADLLRYGLWFVFILSLLRPAVPGSHGTGGDLPR